MHPRTLVADLEHEIERLVIYKRPRVVHPPDEAAQPYRLGCRRVRVADDADARLPHVFEPERDLGSPSVEVEGDGVADEFLL